MKLTILFLMLSLQVFASNNINVPAELEINSDYLKMAKQVHTFEKKLQLRSIPISHLEDELIDFDGDPERLLIHARLSQVETYMRMRGMGQRTIASTSDFDQTSLKKRILKVHRILEGRK